MEQDQREQAGGVTRGQNAVHVIPQDWALIGQFLSTPLSRVDAASDELQLLVLTADAEGAVAVAATAVDLAGDRDVRTLAVTSARRAARVLRSVHPQVLAVSPGELLALVRGASLKLEHLKAVVFAWADELVATGAESTIETLMADVPKDAAKVVVASELSPEVEALIERYARRARRAAPAAEEAAEPVSVEYVVVAPATRRVALRRLLDEADPASAAVIVRSDEGEREARTALRALGFHGDGAAVRVVRGEPGEGELAVLYELPASREELRGAVGPVPRRTIALVQPRQLPSLRALAAGGRVIPLTVSEATARARGREAQLRAELRSLLDGGNVAREVLALEPLLEDFDGIEVAAAALQLLERARTAAPPRAAVEARAGAPAGATARIFVNVGAMDSVRPGDLMGAILNETGIPREAVGRIEIRDTHSLVELEGARAEEVATKLAGTVIKGRRVQARLDQERPARDRGDRAPRGERPMRGDRPARGDRPPRGERPMRGERPPRGDRPARGEGPARGERPMRGDRGGRSDRPGRGDARAARPPRTRREGDAPRRERE